MFNSPDGKVPFDDLRKSLPGCRQMATVLNAVETLPKISITWVGCTNVTDRQTDRRTDDDIYRTTFAKNRQHRRAPPSWHCCSVWSTQYRCQPHRYLGWTVVSLCLSVQNVYHHCHWKQATYEVYCQQHHLLAIFSIIIYWKFLHNESPAVIWAEGTCILARNFCYWRPTLKGKSRQK